MFSNIPFNQQIGTVAHSRQMSQVAQIDQGGQLSETSYIGSDPERHLPSPNIEYASLSSPNYFSHPAFNQFCQMAQPRRPVPNNRVCI
jgi:hypothetical protein